MENKQDFSSYLATEGDLTALITGLNLLESSGLLEKSVVDNTRFVVFDSQNLYIATKGEHSSKNDIKVEKVNLSIKTNFNLFKISHSGFVGRKTEEYILGRQWFLAEEVEETALHASKFYNEHLYYIGKGIEPEKVFRHYFSSPENTF